MAPIPQVFTAILRVAMVGAPILGRAFMDAYKQAMINAAARQSVAKSSGTMIRGSRMTVEEAAKILDVKIETTSDEVKARYERILEANDPAKGGSAYLREKVSLAHRILAERQPRSGGADKKA